MLNDFLKKNDILIIFIIALASRLVLLYKTVAPVLWDAAVYMLNAKWFIGSHIYLELIRPPVWSLILSFFYLLQVPNNGMFFVSILFSALSIVMTYILAKELYGTKAGIIACLVLILIPLHVYWSSLIYTEIPASLFILLSLFFAYKGLKYEKYMYLSVLFASIAFLTRYPAGLVFFSIITYFWLQKKLTLKKLVKMTAVFIAPIIPWMIYNILMTKSPIFSFVYGIFWADQAGAEPFWYFMLYSPIIFSIFVLPIVYALVMSLKEYKHKEIQLLLILLILFLVYICFVCQHKEMRYILPIIPIFAVITGKYAARLKWKTIMMLAPLLLIPICQSYYMLDTEIYNCSEIITASQNLNGTVYSVFWPQTALYGDVKVIGPSTDVSRTHLLLHDTSILDSFISYDRSISYVIVDNDKYAPQNYINNFSFWDSQQYLHLEKQVNGTCFDVRVYKVIY